MLSLKIECYVWVKDYVKWCLLFEHSLPINCCSHINSIIQTLISHSNFSLWNKKWTTSILNGENSSWPWPGYQFTRGTHLWNSLIPGQRSKVFSTSSRSAVGSHPMLVVAKCLTLTSNTSQNQHDIKMCVEHLTLAAQATESGPWAAFLMPSVPKRARRLPGASARAIWEFACPRSLFHSQIASSLRISMATTGPLVINWISSLGNRQNVDLLHFPVRLAISRTKNILRSEYFDTHRYYELRTTGHNEFYMGKIKFS